MLLQVVHCLKKGLLQVDVKILCQHQNGPQAVRQFVGQLGPGFRDLAHAGVGHDQLGQVADVADDERTVLVDSEQGVWGCDMVWNCVEICPKGVPPTQGIGKTRARIRRAQRAKGK